MLITSLDNEKVKKYTKLKNSSFRKKENQFLVEGMHLVLEAYKRGVVIELILLQDEVLPLPTPTVYVTKEVMEKISTMTTPSNVAALCQMMPMNDQLGEKCLLLDEIQDPGNLGTIIRSAKAFGIDTVVLGENTVDLYNPKVIRATQGMLFHINIIKRDLKKVIQELKDKQIPIYGTKVEHGTDIRNFTSKDKQRYALVVGNEGNGVNDDILALCDSCLYIDMHEDVESLNVAIATSILLYELSRM